IIDESCEIALKKLEEDKSSNYQCIKDSKKVLFRAKQKSLSILNVIVLDFGHSNLRALGSSVYFDPKNPPKYEELCSSSGENLSGNGTLDFAAIEYLLNEGIYSVRETIEGNEEIYFSGRIVINTNLTDKEPKKKVCLAPKIEVLQSAINADSEESDDDAITSLSCKDLYKSRDSYHVINAKKQSKMIIAICSGIGGGIALIMVAVVLCKLSSRNAKKPKVFL
ncbi:MAG: hypothetical protein MHMPM18_002304, partial [Marteilia pararefringens]